MRDINQILEITKKACILSSLFLISSASFAGKGGDVSGGGSNFKSDFRTRAEALIIRLNEAQDPVAKNYAERFRKTLDDPAFKIDVVEVLIDPQSGKPVANQRPLYAYGASNYIQLKSTPKNDEGAESWEKKLKAGGNLDPDVFHEMAWAATANDADRDYQISIGRLKLQLNKGVQKSRLRLLKQNTFYVLKGSVSCIYHFEVDAENQSFIMTGSAPGRANDMSDCQGSVYRFRYEEQRDLWIASYKGPVVDNGEASILILPDGNFLLDMLADLKKPNPKYTKFIALGKDEPYRIEGASPYVSAPCITFDMDDMYALTFSRLIEQAIRQGKTSCESLFKNCEMIAIYNKENEGFDRSRSCVRIAVFEGSDPRL